MLLKLDLYLHHSSPVSDKVFMEEALAGLFPRSATFDVPPFTGCARQTFEDSLLGPLYFGAGGSFFSALLLLCFHHNGLPTLLGLATNWQSRRAALRPWSGTKRAEPVSVRGQNPTDAPHSSRPHNIKD